MRNNLKKPCDECPFRRDSAQGWLGPWEPQELMHSLHGTPFPCHKTIKASVAFDHPSTDKMELCAGATLFLNNKIQTSRDPETMMHQKLLDGVDGSEVFQWEHEFMEHHDR